MVFFHLFLPGFAFGLGLGSFACLIFGILFFQEIVGHGGEWVRVIQSVEVWLVGAQKPCAKLFAKCGYYLLPIDVVVGRHGSLGIVEGGYSPCFFFDFFLELTLGPSAISGKELDTALVVFVAVEVFNYIGKISTNV